jgi:hypothetical protein
MLRYAHLDMKGGNRPFAASAKPCSKSWQSCHLAKVSSTGLIELGIKKSRVGGSIPPLGTTFTINTWRFSIAPVYLLR